MVDSQLDTSRWNLFSSAPARRWAIAGIAVAGCGPVLDPAEGTDTDDPTHPTDPTDPTETGPIEDECTANEDCDPNYSCVNGVCQYDYECYCGGCGVAPPPDSKFRCQPWYECYSDDDCPDGVCEAGYCVGGPVDECSNIPITAEATELVFSEASSGPIGALKLANGPLFETNDLLVARGAVIERFANDEGTAILTAPTTILAFATTDVDGDGDYDILTAEDGDAAQLRVWRNDGDAFVQLEATVPMNGASAIEIGDLEGDGALDAWVRRGRDVVVLSSQGGGAFAPEVPVLTGVVDAFALIDDNADGIAEVVYADGSSYVWFSPAPGPDPSPLATAGGEFVSQILVADFSGDARPDVAGLSSTAASLTSIVGPLVRPMVVDTPLSGTFAGAGAGDLDGDGLADLVITQPDAGGLAVHYGTPAFASIKTGPTAPFHCETNYQLGFASTAVAVGSADGIGPAAFVVADDRLYRLMFYGGL